MADNTPLEKIDSVVDGHQKASTNESAEQTTYEIPTECWAAVVKDEGPDFYVEVEKVPVPEIGTLSYSLSLFLFILSDSSHLRESSVKWK